MTIVARTDGGRRIASDLWMLDLARGTRTRFTIDSDDDQDAVWSPDGARLAFRSNRAGSDFQLFVKSASGVLPEEPLWTSDNPKLPVDWSPDGRLLLYIENLPTTRNDLLVLSLADKKSTPVVQTPFQDGWGRFSPDGRWIAYTSDESGDTEVYVLGFPGATTRTQISAAGGARPRWRRDGRELFFMSPAGDGRQAMMAVDTETGSNGSFKAGLPRKLFEIATPQSWDVTADGKRFLLTLPLDQNGGDDVQPIRVLVNWDRRATP